VVNISCDKEVVTISLANREILLRHEEFHSLSEAYMRFYAKESVEAYLERHERQDLTDYVDKIAENLCKDIKYMLDDNETIGAAILAITGETV